MRNDIMFFTLGIVSSFWLGYLWAKHLPLYDQEPVFPLTDVRTLHSPPPICEEDIDPYATGSYVNVVRCGKGKYMKLFKSHGARGAAGYPNQIGVTNVSPDSSNR